MSVRKKSRTTAEKGGVKILHRVIFFSFARSRGEKKENNKLFRLLSPLSFSLIFQNPSQETTMSPTDALQVVDADANFDERAATRAAKAAGLPWASDGRYGVVAVMGPQSSGKSTLLNAMVRERECECSVDLDALF